MFWTRTLWRDPKAMHDFIVGSAHRAAMRGLPNWCDEASVVNWEQDATALASWGEAEARAARRRTRVPRAASVGRACQGRDDAYRLTVHAGRYSGFSPAAFAISSVSSTLALR